MADLTKYESVAKIPEKEIFARSDDGKTVVLVDGTRASDALIAEAKKSRSTAKSEKG